MTNAFPPSLGQRFLNLPTALYHPIQAEPLPNPTLLHWNEPVAELADIQRGEIDTHELAAYLAGNQSWPGSTPCASVYAGHQFGYFVPQLGDGRALLLGDRNGWELQLKGSGRTPWSRAGDGRAVLRSSLREYLCSEAMHGLGVPTTRALSLIGSPLPVWRETEETAAVVLRMSPSFIRFGHFEWLSHHKQTATLRTLADFVITHHFPSWQTHPERYARLFAEITRLTAHLMAHWQSVGFTHGVMNTDNMSILGLTLDYGPFGFLDTYQADFVCNHTDAHGRYAYDQQPDVGAWNLTRLAQAMVSLVSSDELKAILDTYPSQFATHYIQLMSRRLGLKPARQHTGVILGLLELMQSNQLDYHGFFRDLCAFDTSPDAKNHALRDQCRQREQFDQWAAQWRHALTEDGISDADRRGIMLRHNPKYILRNHLAEEIIHEVRDRHNTEVLNDIIRVLHAPFDEHPDLARWAAPPPAGTRIELSCSS